MKKLILILFIPLISFCQDDTKKNGLQKLLKQAEKIYKEIENKGTSDIDFNNTDIGNTNFDIADRIGQLTNGWGVGEAGNDAWVDLQWDEIEK